MDFNATNMSRALKKYFSNDVYNVLVSFIINDIPGICEKSALFMHVMILVASECT